DDEFLKEFESYINKLTDEGKDVILLHQVPKFTSSGFLEEWMLARRYGGKFDYDTNEIYRRLIEGNEKVLQLFSGNDKVHLLDLNPLLGEDGKYHKFDERKLPIYFNSNHLTAHGAEWIYGKIKNQSSYDWVIELAEHSG